MKRVRDHITYANVVATLALFLVLAGGSAVAAKSLLHKNSVGTRQIKNGAITTAKIKNGAVLGSKIDLATLGTVASAANAAHAGTADSARDAAHATRADAATRADSAGDATTLQGNGPNAFVRGDGTLLTFHRELPVGASGVEVLTMPGTGRLTAQCKNGTTYLRGGYIFENQSGSIMDQTNHYGLGVDGGTVASGETIGFAEQELVDAVTVQLATRSTPSTVITLNVSFARNGAAACEMFGHATVSQGS
jgi:hypothetical protein